MTPTVFPWIIGAAAAALAVGAALTLRLPLPFDGFAACVAVIGAGLLTICIVMMAPARWIWKDVERLRHAFAQRHTLSERQSENVLEAIASAYRRAETIQSKASLFADPLNQRARNMAARLEDVAKDLFYNPDALAVHRAALVRSELIEEAVLNHASLRKRAKAGVNDAQIELSRDRVDSALAALEDAFDHNEKRLADRLLSQVDVSSAVAERLLKRRSV